MWAWAALASVAAVAAFFGSVLAVGLFLSAPHPSYVGPPPDTLPGAETVQIASSSGASLRGWWMPGRPGAGVVLLMHGLGGNRTQMTRRAAALHQAGFACLLFDFGAEGESSGARITFGRNEALDAAAALAFAHARAPGERAGAIGMSLGGAAALLGPVPLRLDALVLESVYPDFNAALGNRLRIGLGPTLGPIFTPLLVPAFRLLMPPVLGVRPGELAPITRIGSITEPVLVASGTDDPYTPLPEAKALFAQAQEPKQFWAVPGVGHADLEQHDPGAYWRLVLPFLQHLRSAQ